MILASEAQRSTQCNFGAKPMPTGGDFVGFLLRPNQSRQRHFFRNPLVFVSNHNKAIHHAKDGSHNKSRANPAKLAILRLDDSDLGHQNYSHLYTVFPMKTRCKAVKFSRSFPAQSTRVLLGLPHKARTDSRTVWPTSANPEISGALR